MERWQHQKSGGDQYLMKKSVQFRKYKFNIYILQRAALRIQHWYIQTKIIKQKGQHQWASNQSNHSLHQKVQEETPLTIHEKERDSLRKLVALKLQTPEISESPEFKNSKIISFLNTPKKQNDQPQIKQTQQIDVTPTERPSITSNSSKLLRQSRQIIDKFKCFGQTLEEQSYNQRVSRGQNKETISSTLEISSNSDITNINQTTQGAQSNSIYRKYRPSKDINEALNIREGENRAKQVFDSFQRERQYMSKQRSLSNSPENTTFNVQSNKDGPPTITLFEVQNDNEATQLISKAQSILEKIRSNKGVKDIKEQTMNIQTTQDIQQIIPKSPIRQASPKRFSPVVASRNTMIQKPKSLDMTKLKGEQRRARYERNQKILEQESIIAKITSDTKEDNSQIIEITKELEQFELTKQKNGSHSKKPPLPKTENISNKERKHSFRGGNDQDKSIDFDGYIVSQQSLNQTDQRSPSPLARSPVPHKPSINPLQQTNTTLTTASGTLFSSKTSIGKSLRNYMAKKLIVHKTKTSRQPSPLQSQIHQINTKISLFGAPKDHQNNNNNEEPESFLSRHERLGMNQTKPQNDQIEERDDHSKSRVSVSPINQRRKKPEVAIKKQPMITGVIQQPPEQSEHKQQVSKKQDIIGESPRRQIPQPEDKPQILVKQSFDQRRRESSTSNYSKKSSKKHLVTSRSNGIFQRLSKIKSYDKLEPVKLNGLLELNISISTKRQSVVHNFNQQSSISFKLDESTSLSQLNSQYYQNKAKLTKKKKVVKTKSLDSGVKRPLKQDTPEQQQKNLLYMQNVVNNYLPRNSAAKIKHQSTFESPRLSQLRNSISKKNQESQDRMRDSMSANKRHNFEPNQINSNKKLQSKRRIKSKNTQKNSASRLPQMSPEPLSERRGAHYLMPTDSNSVKRRDKFRQESKKLGDMAISQERQAWLSEAIHRSNEKRQDI